MRTIAAIVAIGALAAGLASADPPAAVDGYQGGGPLLGNAPKVAPPPYRERWRFTAGDGDRAAISGIVIRAGTAFIADGRGGLYALSLADGKPRWNWRIEEGFAGVPLLVGDRLFIADSAGVVHAVNAKDGRKLWTFETESQVQGSLNSDGVHVFATNDGGRVVALRPEDGKAVWDKQAGDRINNAAAAAGGVVFVAGCDSQLHGLDAKTGEERFVHDLQNVAPASPAVTAEGVAVGTDQGRVALVSLDGKKRLWTYEEVEGGAMVYASPAVADGVVVVGARDRAIHAIDLKTGKRKWVFRTPGDADVAAVICDGRAYVGSRGRRLHVLDLRTGEKLWEMNMPRGIGAPVAIGEGVILVGDEAGNVVCLEPGE